MKSFLVFIGGFVAGILATILFLYLIAVADKPNDGLIGLTKFPEKGECIQTKTQLEIFQVVEPTMALAETGNYPDRIMVLLINYDGKSYYDNQKIIVPAKNVQGKLAHINTGQEWELTKLFLLLLLSNCKN